MMDLDLLGALIEEWIPLKVDRIGCSPDAQLIFFGLLAVAEQLKAIAYSSDSNIFADTTAQGAQLQPKGEVDRRNKGLRK
jgi:hypothetical protein